MAKTPSSKSENSPANKKKSGPLRITKDKSFPIVAIGASAGGLEAVTLLLQNLPANLGMAFIYVQHLSPDYRSILTELLAKSTLMKVHEAKNRMLVEKDNFYVIPPDKEMTFTDGHIKLTPRKKDQAINLPIDAFFTSLAEKHKENSIGIILSGSAADGTRGLKAIKQEGGLTFAQDSSAKYSGMPESAIAEGVVDFILAPNEIALELTHLNKNSFVKQGALRAGGEDAIENSDPNLKTILQLLFKKTGVDFSHYKMNTIKRRIIRRMPLLKIKSLKEYSKLLAQKSNEIDLLYNDLLINVTDFFRDPEVFLYLKTTLLPRLLKSKTSDGTLRIWVPACSSGEEVYSIAMTLLEIQDSKFQNLPLQIFATDLSALAIAKARNGEYSEHQLESVSPKRLQRFFTKHKNTYRINKSIRDICVFAQHNILRDPPFSRIDFISCCNLLIYFDASAQKKAIATFYYALNEGGCLMLGKSETVGTSTQLFNPLSKKFKIYLRKKSSGTRRIPDIVPLFSHVVSPQKKLNTLPKNSKAHSVSQLDSAVDALLLAHYMPASVVINYDMEILQFRGSTSLYLRHSSGKASLNILKMARPEFAFELRNAIHKVIKSKKTFRKTGIEIKTDSLMRVFTLEVTPLHIEGEEPLLLVLFSEQQQVETFPESYWGSESKKISESAKVDAKSRLIRKLEEELATVRADVLTISHDNEAVNEELQSANEEVVSNNEELRTLNEELETSKEEIESTNEELITTNGELLTRNEEIKELNNYSEAVIATIHNPLLVLGKDLHIKFANKQFYKNFHVTEHETIGTSLFKLGNKQWDIPALHKLFEVIHSKNNLVSNFEVSHKFPGIGEKTMLLNANWIVQKNSHEQLILLAIEDITEQANMHAKELKLLKEIQLANKEFEIKNEELSAFNYIATHDLQKPLRKIQTFSGEIQKKEKQNLSEEGKDYFERMLSATKRMQTLINDLFEYSRATKAERKYEMTDINKIVKEVNSDLNETINEKKAVIKAGELCHISIIRFQFRQLMYNLISNALKFSHANRKPLITIKSKTGLGSKFKNEKLSPEISYCHITVTDNGIGFDPKYKDRIFEVFQRLHSQDEYKGTGIGLAICKKIVENHQGIISATGKLDKGSRFDIYIPSQ